MLKRIGFCNFELFLLFITGFIVGTHWAEYILSSIGINVFIFEIYLVPYLLYKRKIIFTYIIKKHFFDFVFVLLVYVLIGGVFLGTLNTNGDFFSVVTTTRPLFYMIFIIRFFSELKIISIDKLFSWSIATVIGELLFIVLIYKDYSPGRIWFYVNSITLALVVLIPLVEKKFLKSIFSVLLALFISIVSGYRINLVIFSVSLILGLSFISYKVLIEEKSFDYRTLTKKSVILLIILFIPISMIKFYLQLIDVVAFLFNMNSKSILRITDRLIYFLSGDMVKSQDNIRIEAFKKIISEFVKNIIPNGLVGKTFGYTGFYTDVPILYLYESLGSILSVIVVIVLGFFGGLAFVKSFSKDAFHFDVVCGLMFPITCILLIINGTFIYFANVSIITGIIISRWIRNFYPYINRFNTFVHNAVKRKTQTL